MRIAKGEPMWELKTTGGTTLYLCLEDTLSRVQNRLLCITDEVPPNADSATLYCTGRDVEDRQLELRFSKEEFVWKMLGDSMENREMLLPKEMELLVEFMKVQKNYSGSNTEFCERYNEYAGQAVSARGLKRLMNLREYRLADFGLRFRSHRSNGARLLEIEYSFSAGDESAVGDG